jgi:hypothetical protein
MVRAEKITSGPVGKGTRFRSAVASRGRTAEMLIECTGYDRPKLFTTTTAMAQADIGHTLRFEPATAGTRMRWSRQVRPKGAFRLLGPLITWMGIRQEPARNRRRRPRSGVQARRRAQSSPCPSRKIIDPGRRPYTSASPEPDTPEGSAAPSARPA